MAIMFCITLLLCASWIGTGSAESGSLCDIHSDGATIFVHCVNKHLVSLPKVVPDNVTHLYLSFNDFTSLDLNIVRNFSKLQVLDMNGCKVETIDPKVFEAAPALSELHLDYNHIKIITTGMFSDAHRLDILSLNNNNLEKIENKAFTGVHLSQLHLHNNPSFQYIGAGAFFESYIEILSLDNCNFSTLSYPIFAQLRNSLKVLYVSYNNQPLQLSDGVLNGFNMNSVRLENNSIQSLGFMKGLRLVHLHMNDNSLQALDLGCCPTLRYTETLTCRNCSISSVTLQGTFSLERMKILDLSYNHITSITQSLVEKFSVLRYLHLDNNNLITIGEYCAPLLSNLLLFNITKNELHCDCRLNWMLRLPLGVKRNIVGGMCSVPYRKQLMAYMELPCIKPRFDNVTCQVSSRWGDSSTFSLHMEIHLAVSGLPLPTLSCSINTTHQVAANRSPPSVGVTSGLMTGDQKVFLVTVVLDKHTLDGACHQLPVPDTDRKIDSDSIVLECLADNQQGSDGKVFDVCSLRRHFSDDKITSTNKHFSQSVTLILALTLSFGVVLLGVLIGLKIKWVRHKLACNCKKLFRSNTDGATLDNTTSSEICLIASEVQHEVI